MQNLKIPRALWWLFLFLLTLPLWFIFMNPFHDWGDDFAQYLLQARNLPWFSFTGTGYAPSVKGWFFSVLLAPAAIGFPSNEILASKVIVTSFAVASVFPLYFLATRRLNIVPLAALSLCGFYLFNYQSLLIKDQILPEFVFIFTSATALCMTSSSKRQHIIAGLALALLTVGIKSSGWVLFVVLLMFTLRSEVISTPVRRMVLLIVLMVLGTSFLLLPSSSGVVWYIQQTVTRFSLHTMFEQVSVYYHTIPKFFEMEIPMWMNKSIFLFFGAGWLGGIADGVRRFYKAQSGLITWLTAFQLIYLMMLIVYPYAGEPFRFLFPLLPFSLLSCVSFYNRIMFRLAMLPFIGPAMFCVMLTNLPGAQKAMKMQPDYGPFRSESQELFQFLKSNPQFPATRCSEKPFAFTYFTGLPFLPVTSNVPPRSRWVISAGHRSGLSVPVNMVQVYSNTEWTVFDEQNPAIP